MNFQDHNAAIRLRRQLNRPLPRGGARGAGGEEGRKEGGDGRETSNIAEFGR